MPKIEGAVGHEVALQGSETAEKDLELGDDMKMQPSSGSERSEDKEAATSGGEDSKAWKNATQEIPKNNLALVFLA
jgi:hypothetical protein